MGPSTQSRPPLGVLGSRVGRRLILLFLGCALVPLMVFGWLALSRVSSRLHEETERTLHRNAKAAGMELAHRLLTLSEELEIAADLCAGGVQGLTDATPALRARLQDQFHAVGLQRGASVTSAWGQPMPLPAQGGETREHLATGRWLVQVGRDVHEEDGLRISFARRLHKNGDDPTLFIADLRHRTLIDLETMRGSGSQVLVLANNMGSDGGAGNIVVDGTISAPDLAPLQAMLWQRPSAATFAWEVDGTPHLARYWRVFLRPRLGLDWIVVQSRARSAVEAPLQTFQSSFALAAILTFLLVVIASTVQLRHTLAPIRQLVATTRRVAGGDLDARADLRSSDEFGELGRSFDHMTEQLVENIRRRQQTELDLIEARDAALAAARAKADFLTNVSHELRTPLTAIVSSAEILRQFGEEDPASRAEFLGIVVEESKRLRDLIEGVLELTDSGSGDFEPTDLGATLRAAVDVLPAPVRTRIRLDVPPGLPRLAAMPSRLVLLWRHLADNAAKFSEPDSEIAISVRNEGDRCAVEVTDHGVGIDTSEQQRIFEPFQQVVRDLLTDKARGIGLGLTLARSITERHGGQISLRSTPGVGSTFRVELPLRFDHQHPRSVHTAQPEPAAPTPGGNPWEAATSTRRTDAESTTEPR